MSMGIGIGHWALGIQASTSLKIILCIVDHMAIPYSIMKRPRNERDESVSIGHGSIITRQTESLQGLRRYEHAQRSPVHDLIIGIGPSDFGAIFNFQAQLKGLGPVEPKTGSYCSQLLVSIVRRSDISTLSPLLSSPTSLSPYCLPVLDN